MRGTIQFSLALSFVLLGSCDTSRTELAPSCNELRKMASDTISSAAATVEQCRSKADCKFVEYGPFDCVDCLFILGNDDVKAAIATKAASVRQICQTFKNSGCKLMPSGCP